MIRFEWKKIFERRLNVIAMLMGYVLIGVCVVMRISQSNFYDEKTQTYVYGVDAVRMDQQRAEAQTVYRRSISHSLSARYRAVIWIWRVTRHMRK